MVEAEMSNTWQLSSCNCCCNLLHFAALAATVSNCSCSAHTMNQWQPLHEIFVGTIISTMMEGGFLIIPRAVDIEAQILLPTVRR